MRRSYEVASLSRSGMMTVVLAALCTGTALADAKQPQVINPFVQQTVSKNMAEVEALLEKALDKTAPSESRVDAVRRLSGLYFDYLLANAGDLVRDQDAEVAAATVQSLSGQIAMLPDTSHAINAPPSSGEIDYDAYQLNVVQTSLAALRAAACEHPDPKVHGEAAAFLSSRGDAEGLACIQRLIDQGRMTATQGIQNYSLAPPSVASAYIEKYVASPDPEVQAAAIGQLAYNPSYTVMIRELVLSPDAQGGLVSTALPGLARTDDQFLTYGLALAQNPDLDAAVRNQAFESTITYTLRSEASEAAVRTLLPLLTQTADELSSPTALESLESLKSTYDIQ